MAKVQVLKRGEFNYQRVYPFYKDHEGREHPTIIDMKDVDEEGYYVVMDKNGEPVKKNGKYVRKLFPVLDGKGRAVPEYDEMGQPKKDKDGKAIMKTELRKCRWVGPIGSHMKAKVDPQKLAAVISGKAPGTSDRVSDSVEE